MGTQRAQRELTYQLPRNGEMMVSPLSKISEFLKGPQGRKLTEQAKRYAQDPSNRAKAQQMIDKLRGGKGSSGKH